MTISRDEWLAALGAAALPLEPDALSIRELSEMFGIPRKTTEEKMRDLVEKGKARRTVKLTTNALGHPRRVAAYVLIK